MIWGKDEVLISGSDFFRFVLNFIAVYLNGSASLMRIGMAL